MYLAWQVPHNVYEVPDAYRDPSIDCSGRQTIEAMIHMMDEGVANVTSALERRGLWNSTLFIFLADNGGLLHGGTYGSNYPLRGSKTTAFEGGVRTLAFVSGGYLAAALHASSKPDQSPQRQFDGLVHSVDWHAVICQLAGANLADPNPDAATLPPVEALDFWDMLLASATSSSSQPILGPRFELPLAFCEGNVASDVCYPAGFAPNGSAICSGLPM